MRRRRKVRSRTQMLRLLARLARRGVGEGMRPYYSDAAVTIYHADCFDVLHDLSGIGAVVTDPPYSSGGAFRGDRAQQTTTKYVNSDTAAYRPEFAGDNRDQRSFCAWATMWLSAFAIVRAVNRAAGVEP